MRLQFQLGIQLLAALLGKQEICLSGMIITRFELLMTNATLLAAFRHIPGLRQTSAVGSASWRAAAARRLGNAHLVCRALILVRAGPFGRQPPTDLINLQHMWSSALLTDSSSL